MLLKIGLCEKQKKQEHFLFLQSRDVGLNSQKKCLEIRNPWTDENIGKGNRLAQVIRRGNPIGQREYKKQPQLAKTTISHIISSKTESMEGTNKWDYIFFLQSLALD